MFIEPCSHSYNHSYKNRTKMSKVQKLGKAHSFLESCIRKSGETDAGGQEKNGMNIPRKRHILDKEGGFFLSPYDRSAFVFHRHFLSKRSRSTASYSFFKLGGAINACVLQKNSIKWNRVNIFTYQVHPDAEHLRFLTLEPLSYALGTIIKVFYFLCHD